MEPFPHEGREAMERQGRGGGCHFRLEPNELALLLFSCYVLVYYLECADQTILCG